MGFTQENIDLVLSIICDPVFTLLVAFRLEQSSIGSIVVYQGVYNTNLDQNLQNCVSRNFRKICIKL